MNHYKICICGIGYVGLTLAAVMAEKGFDVVGVEIKPEVVESLNNGRPHFHEIGLNELLQRHIHKNLKIVSSIPDETFDAFIITVGTPLRKGAREPELEYIKKVAADISNHLYDGSLVILRSTVSIGTSRNVVLPVLQKACKSVHIAFCPERTMEGKALEELKYLPQIIGGLDEESIKKAEEIFRNITPTVIKVSSLETAEVIKLLDNAYRDSCFAFANEVAAICEHTSVDAQEVIQWGKFNYPRTNIPIPGYVRGACLEKDPHILIHSTSKLGYTPNLVKQSREIHEQLPFITIDRIKQLLHACGKKIGDCKILLAGMAFKGDPETDDLRGSPAFLFMEALARAGAGSLQVHDFVVREDNLRALGLVPVSLEEGFQDADAVIIANNHSGYRRLNILEYVSTMRKPAVFYDGWRLFDKNRFAEVKGILYEGLGFRNENTNPEEMDGGVIAELDRTTSKTDCGVIFSE